MSPPLKAQNNKTCWKFRGWPHPGYAYETQLKFQEATHLPCQGWVCGVYMTKVCNWNFQNSLHHFWIRTRNKCPVISDLAIHKLLAFCTIYLCEAAFSKLMIIKLKKQSFFKMLRVTFVLCCLVSIYKWMICVKTIKCIHPITCAW